MKTMNDNEAIIAEKMMEIEKIIQEKGIDSQRHNIAQTVKELRSRYPECNSLITDSLEGVRVRNNLTSTWENQHP